MYLTSTLRYISRLFAEEQSLMLDPCSPKAETLVLVQGLGKALSLPRAKDFLWGLTSRSGLMLRTELRLLQFVLQPFRVNHSFSLKIKYNVILHYGTDGFVSYANIEPLRISCGALARGTGDNDLATNYWAFQNEVTFS